MTHLIDIADRIHEREAELSARKAQHRKDKQTDERDYWATGADLSAARKELVADQDFGNWFSEQRFSLDQSRARRQRRDFETFGGQALSEKAPDRYLPNQSLRYLYIDQDATEEQITALLEGTKRTRDQHRVDVFGLEPINTPALLPTPQTEEATVDTLPTITQEDILNLLPPKYQEPVHLSGFSPLNVSRSCPALNVELAKLTRKGDKRELAGAIARIWQTMDAITSHQLTRIVAAKAEELRKREIQTLKRDLANAEARADKLQAGDRPLAVGGLTRVNLKFMLGATHVGDRPLDEDKMRKVYSLLEQLDRK